MSPISPRVETAVHLLVILARAARGGERAATSEQIADSIGTNPVVVRRLVGVLRKAKLVNTKRGIGGGITLARPADKVSIRDAYEAVDRKGAAGRGKADAIGVSVSQFLGKSSSQIDKFRADLLSKSTIADVEKAAPAVTKKPKR